MFTRQKTKGFTLIELLVVIAIIALLLSIILPSLNMAKDVARRLICANHLKGFGTAMHMYSKDYNDKMMPNIRYDAKKYDDGLDSTYAPWSAYIVGNYDYGTDTSEFLNAYQHGKLYSLQYLEEPDRYYCPAAFQNLKGAGEGYRWNYYFEEITKSMPPHKSNGWGGRDDDNGHSRCRSSYMYWTWEKTSFLELTNKPVVVDSLSKIGHKKGDKYFGLNALFGDGHVSATLLTSSPVLREGIDEDGWTLWVRDYDRTVEVLKALQP